MTWGEKLKDSLWVSLHELKKFLIMLSSLKIKLLVHFGRETWNEWFKDSTKKSQCIKSYVDNLSTSFFVGLVKIPRLVILSVDIASLRQCHSGLKRVLDLNLLHQLKISSKELIDLVDELLIVCMNCTCVSWDLRLESAHSKLKDSVREIS